LNQGFAPEEKGGILYVEHAQPAIRTLAFVNSFARTGPRLNPANAANQSMKCIHIIERIAEFNPGRGG
jgi:hypothetical protein